MAPLAVPSSLWTATTSIVAAASPVSRHYQSHAYQIVATLVATAAPTPTSFAHPVNIARAIGRLFAPKPVADFAPTPTLTFEAAAPYGSPAFGRAIPATTPLVLILVFIFALILIQSTLKGHARLQHAVKGVITVVTAMDDTVAAERNTEPPAIANDLPPGPDAPPATLDAKPRAPLAVSVVDHVRGAPEHQVTESAEDDAPTPKPTHAAALPDDGAHTPVVVVAQPSFVTTQDSAVLDRAAFDYTDATIVKVKPVKDAHLADSARQFETCPDTVKDIQDADLSLVDAAIHKLKHALTPISEDGAPSEERLTEKPVPPSFALVRVAAPVPVPVTPPVPSIIQDTSVLPQAVHTAVAAHVSRPDKHVKDVDPAVVAMDSATVANVAAAPNPLKDKILALVDAPTQKLKHAATAHSKGCGAPSGPCLVETRDKTSSHIPVTTAGRENWGLSEPAPKVLGKRRPNGNGNTYASSPASKQTVEKLIKEPLAVVAHKYNIAQDTAVIAIDQAPTVAQVGTTNEASKDLVHHSGDLPAVVQLHHADNYSAIVDSTLPVLPSLIKNIGVLAPNEGVAVAPKAVRPDKHVKDSDPVVVAVNKPKLYPSPPPSPPENTTPALVEPAHAKPGRVHLAAVSEPSPVPVQDSATFTPASPSQEFKHVSARAKIDTHSGEREPLSTLAQDPTIPAAAADAIPDAAVAVVIPEDGVKEENLHASADAFNVPPIADTHTDSAAEDSSLRTPSSAVCTDEDPTVTGSGPPFEDALALVAQADPRKEPNFADPGAPSSADSISRAARNEVNALEGPAEEAVDPVAEIDQSDADVATTSPVLNVAIPAASANDVVPIGDIVGHDLNDSENVDIASLPTGMGADDLPERKKKTRRGGRRWNRRMRKNIGSDGNSDDREADSDTESQCSPLNDGALSELQELDIGELPISEQGSSISLPRAGDAPLSADRIDATLATADAAHVPDTIGPAEATSVTDCANATLDPLPAHLPDEEARNESDDDMSSFDEVFNAHYPECQIRRDGHGFLIIDDPPVPASDFEILAYDSTPVTAGTGSSTSNSSPSSAPSTPVPSSSTTTLLGTTASTPSRLTTPASSRPIPETEEADGVGASSVCPTDADKRDRPGPSSAASGTVVCDAQQDATAEPRTRHRYIGPWDRYRVKIEQDDLWEEYDGIRKPPMVFILSASEFWGPSTDQHSPHDEFFAKAEKKFKAWYELQDDVQGQGVTRWDAIVYGTKTSKPRRTKEQRELLSKLGYVGPWDLYADMLTAEDYQQDASLWQSLLFARLDQKLKGSELELFRAWRTANDARHPGHTGLYRSFWFMNKKSVVDPKPKVAEGSNLQEGSTKTRSRGGRQRK